MTWQVLCRQLAIWWFSRCLPRAISIYWSEKHSSSSTEGLIFGIRRKKYGWSSYCNRNIMMNSKWKFEDTATVICDLWQSVNHSKWAAKMEEERLLLLGIWHEFDLSHHTCRRKERALLDQVQSCGWHANAVVNNCDDIVSRFDWKVSGREYIICPGSIVTTRADRAVFRCHDLVGCGVLVWSVLIEGRGAKASCA